MTQELSTSSGLGQESPLSGIGRTKNESPYHVHNGVDNSRVQVKDLDRADFYIAVRVLTLTAAQVKALNTTPITLVPAVQKAILIVEDIEAKLTFNTVAHTGANALEFRYTDAAGAKVTADMAAAFINSASTAYRHVAGVVTELTPVVSSPIVVTVPVANPATGNSPITFVVKYRVVTF